ncbi:MAG TPA: response regulator [Fimbriimonas sp.]|nr:response regulator [Fimbriimonas sp.]
MLSTRPVLLVEDNPDDERLALVGLKKAGVKNQVDIARDGEEALALVQGQADGFSLILLDLKLPKIGGLDVLAHIKDAYGQSSPPIVVFTSSDEPIDISRSRQLGANEFVTKPIDFNEYVEAIRKIAATFLS